MTCGVDKQLIPAFGNNALQFGECTFTISMQLTHVGCGGFIVCDGLCGCMV